MIESEFRAAFEEHKNTVYGFAWRMTNSSDVAEDITQDAFLSLLRQPGKFDATRGQMRSFLLGIARNLVLKHFRREQNRWCALDEEQFAAQPVDIASREIAEIIGGAVQALPPLQREVLVLAELEHLLNVWVAPNAPQDLEDKFFPGRFRWWQWLFPRQLLVNHGRRSKRPGKV
jgi:RNA polymerase sigma factor (sigma-70 family)